MTPLEETRDQRIEELRRAMGTLPSEAPILKTEIWSLEEAIKVDLVSTHSNPYIPIFEGACATWGDDRYEFKWPRVTPPNRFKVCLAALTGQTLPQVLEVVNFLFRVWGTPRWLFEEHARKMSQFTTYFSIGCRDNNKLDASMVVASEVPVSYLVLAKENYRQVVEEGQESWQSARALLPMSYHHPYFYSTSLLSLISNLHKYARVSEGAPEMALLLRRSVEAVSGHFPLIGQAVCGAPPKEDEYISLDPKDRSLFEEESIG